MAIRAEKRPLRCLRRDSTDTPVAIGGTVDSYGAPCYGWGVVNVQMLLTQAGTLVIYQRLRASSTWIAVATYALAAAGSVSDVVPVTGEQVRALFTNGGVQQSPEILVSLA